MYAPPSKPRRNSVKPLRQSNSYRGENPSSLNEEDITGEEDGKTPQVTDQLSEEAQNQQDQMNSEGAPDIDLDTRTTSMEDLVKALTDEQKAELLAILTGEKEPAKEGEVDIEDMMTEHQKQHDDRENS